MEEHSLLGPFSIETISFVEGKNLERRPIPLFTPVRGDLFGAGSLLEYRDY